MRYRVIAFLSVVLCAFAPLAPAGAQETPKNDVKGLFLLTDYPAVSVRPGTTATVNLKLQNYALPPERLEISVSGVPSGWTSTMLGGGQPVGAVLPATNSSVSVELRLDVPKEAPLGTTNLTVTAKGPSTTVTLPVAVTLVKDLPAKLTVNPQLPDLRGTSKSTFEYQLSIKNESGKKLLVALSAQAPQNFNTSFTEQYGSQELNAVPLDANQSKDVKLKVNPPNTVAAGQYKVSVKATAEDATVTHRARPRCHRRAQARHLRPRGRALDARVRRQGNDRGDRGQQYRHGPCRAGRALRFRSERLEDQLQPEDHRQHPAQRHQGSAGPDHAHGQGGRRRLSGDAAGELAGRLGQPDVPRGSDDLHDLGDRRRCADRRRAADHGRCSHVVWSAMSDDNVIQAENLTKRYNGTAVVNGISFSVARGEIFGLLGPNGAGKTTTILMLLGLSDITAGQARVLGHDPQREPLQVKRRVGYLPDQVGFYDNLTAADNLRYTARLIGLDHAEREERIASSLAHVGLAEVANKRVATFSRGMRQRVGLAEILMKDAEIAILDEPTSGLDPQATLELLEIIRALKHRGVTVLLSSHLLERVQSICDRVALFSEGKIVLLGTVPELGRQVLGGGYHVEVEAEGDRPCRAAERHTGCEGCRDGRHEPDQAFLRARCAAGSGGRGSCGWWPVVAAVGRGAQPRNDLYPLLPNPAAATRSGPCNVKVRPCGASVL